jgi:histidine ammonia-lyase
MIREAMTTIETEIKSPNDNPIIDHVNGKSLHETNFQGSAMGFYMDYVRVFVVGLGRILFS